MHFKKKKISIPVSMGFFVFAFLLFFLCPLGAAVAFATFAEYLFDSTCGSSNKGAPLPPFSWTQKQLPFCFNRNSTSERMTWSTVGDPTVLVQELFNVPDCVGQPASTKSWPTPSCITTWSGIRNQSTFTQVIMDMVPNEKKYSGSWIHLRYRSAGNCSGAFLHDEHLPPCYLTDWFAIRTSCAFPQVSIGVCAHGPNISVSDCTVCPVNPLPQSGACWESSTNTSADIIECYNEGQCPWGLTCTCASAGKCAVIANDLDFAARTSVPVPDFTIVGNATLQSGLSMAFGDKVLIKGHVTVGGVLSVSNISTSGTFLLFDLSTAESTSPTITGSFSAINLTAQNSSCHANGQIVQSASGLSLVVTLGCSGGGLPWYGYLGMALGLIALGAVLAVTIVLVTKAQSAKYTASARAQINAKQMNDLSTSYKRF